MHFDRLIPVVFVMLWSTGWVVAKYASPNADPLTFLSLRYTVAIFAFVLICLSFHIKIFGDKKIILHGIISGIFLHGLYLGSVWWVIGHGIPAAISGFISALQPMMTALLAVILISERLSILQWIGLVLGFLGVFLAIVPDLLIIPTQDTSEIAWLLIINVAGMAAITYGTVYQKAHLKLGDLRLIALMQYAGALIVTLPAAYFLEEMYINLNLDFFLALFWSAIGLSVGALILLLMLIRRGQVSKAASLNYLVPPVIAIQTYFYFDEKITIFMVFGTIIVILGVYLINQKKTKTSA